MTVHELVPSCYLMDIYMPSYRIREIHLENPHCSLRSLFLNIIPCKIAPLTMERSMDTAHLETLSFAKLARNDTTELDRLLHACQQQGFFYLDLADSSASQGLDDRRQALSLTQGWFDRPTEEKMKLYQDSVTKGYVVVQYILQ